MGTLLAVAFGIAMGVYLFGVSRRRPQAMFEVAGAQVRVGGAQRNSTLYVGTLAACSLHFEVRPETSLDRFAKAIGLSVEMQLGRDAFDRRFYLVADDPRVLALLRSFPGLVDALQKLTLEWRSGYRLRCLRVRQGRVWLELSGGRATATPAFIEQVAVQCKAIAAQLPRESLPRPTLDSVYLRTALLLAFAFGLFCYGGAQALIHRRAVIPHEIVSGPLWSAAWPLAGCLLLALSLLVLSLVDRTSRTHQTLLAVLLFGGFSAPLSSFFLVEDLNIARGGPPEYREVRVVNKYLVRSRRSPTRRYLIVYDEQLGRIELQLRASDYERWAPGQRARMSLHSGYFGAPWVSGIEPLRPGSESAQP